MEIIFNYCRQTRRYGDSEGLCLVKLAEGDNKEEIIKDFTKERNWYEQKYYFAKELNKYEHNGYNGTVIYEGDLLLFKTYQIYLD